MIQENVPLAPMTTFGLGGAARWFVEVRSEVELAEGLAWAAAQGMPVFVLGGGSNLLVPDEGFPGLVLRIDIRGVQQDKPWSPEFFVGAGEAWDSFVDVAVDSNCAGIECLAGIPGRVGGTPVQNVGAYGQDVSQTIRQVRVFDRHRSELRWLTNDECRFRYRQSIFNTDEPGRYVVTAVVFQLRYGPPTLSYADLQKRFSARWKAPGLREVADAVREIRRSKGMLLVDGDPDTHSAGSFFKNPIVNAGLLGTIAATAGVAPEAVPHWPAGDGRIKLAAAWLLEHAGFVKGFTDGVVGISSRHTLALINRGGATFADVERFEQRIRATVEAKFGVTLTREPVVLG
ncbi:UDP-N-acetylmuramate dehydrogenase [Bryocella elongata]|uniref:UDP-N-acetylmuramate dehydrogenase n=1 Tax=Bryocella elongata TaxID=863522 RepID=UPI002E0DF149